MEICVLCTLAETGVASRTPTAMDANIVRMVVDLRAVGDAELGVQPMYLCILVCHPAVPADRVQVAQLDHEGPILLPRWVSTPRQIVHM